MFKKILIVVVLAVAGICVYAALLPSEYSVSREILISAKPEAVFPYINNSKRTNEWMPWAESDPDIKMIYSGPDEGIGSTATWESPGRMGNGQAVIVESIPDHLVRTQLTYTKPMDMSQMADLTLTPSTEGEGTLVRWSVSGKNSFVGRLFCIFMNMDKMVGEQFIKGLTKLKSMAESPQ